MRLNKILDIVDGKLISGNPNTSFWGFSTDSRNIKEGDLFFAFAGDKFDGNDFVTKALEKGAAGAIVSRVTNYPDNGKSMILVDDTLAALGSIAHYFRRSFSGKVIAVTGSNGKTMTKDIIHAVLSKKFKVLKSERNFNNLIGLPLTLLKLDKNFDACVLEMGTNRFGEIEKLTDIAEPDIGLITSISNTHLEGFGSRGGVLREKLNLLMGMKGDNKIGIINRDDISVSKVKNNFNGRIVTYGIRSNCNFKAFDVKSDLSGLSFSLNRKVRFDLNLLGWWNVYNALASISVARELGLDFEVIEEVLTNFVPPPMRMEKKYLNGVTVINDCYNSNPESLSRAVAEFCKWGDKKRKVLICGDMLELGNRSRFFHKKIGREISEHGLSVLVGIGEHVKSLLEEARRKRNGSIKIFSFRNVQEAVKEIRHILSEGDLVLIKGSRGVGLEKIEDSLLSSR